ncbi:MAG: Hydroxyacylglutathione hydrolase GloC [Phycisphaerae bacterium]|nr:Hydroxyacylglutathione hydrolase GloC [Phycisphaerae bacterium]
MLKRHGDVNIEVFVDNMFAENALLVWCDGHADCWMVDPGFPPSPERLLHAVATRGLKPVMILLTHCHPDHIAGVGPIRSALPSLPIVAPRGEEHMLTDATANLSAALGFPIVTPAADRLLAAGDTLTLGESRWDSLDVAGHSPAGLAYYCRAAGLVISGDALFAGSIGRYDFPGCSRDRLLHNIVHNLLTLPDETTLYPGHGPASTIGHERTHNAVLLAELQA